MRGPRQESNSRRRQMRPSKYRSRDCRTGGWADRPVCLRAPEGPWSDRTKILPLTSLSGQGSTVRITSPEQSGARPPSPAVGKTKSAAFGVREEGQFLEHGTQKLLGFPPPPNPGPALFSLLGLQGIIELVGGILILIGFLTRPVALVLADDMAVAYFMAHGKLYFAGLRRGRG